MTCARPQNRPDEAPKMPQKETENGSRYPQVCLIFDSFRAPKSHIEPSDAKLAQEGPKMAPSWPQVGPKSSSLGPLWAPLGRQNGV